MCHHAQISLTFPPVSQSEIVHKGKQTGSTNNDERQPKGGCDDVIVDTGDPGDMFIFGKSSGPLRGMCTGWTNTAVPVHLML